MYKQDEIQFYRDRVSNGTERCTIYCTCLPYIWLKNRTVV